MIMLIPRLRSCTTLGIKPISKPQSALKFTQFKREIVSKKYEPRTHSIVSNLNVIDKAILGIPSQSKRNFCAVLAKNPTNE